FASSSRKFEAISPATSEVGPLISVSLAELSAVLAFVRYPPIHLNEDDVLCARPAATSCATYRGCP
ncbi:hypothetical protein, partial [Burkholderia multivorans]|uniref:hypothetical protein n=1 Tax=Burkholderia multivorans TaxID=87883 RepID=UPI001E38C4C6